MTKETLQMELRLRILKWEDCLGSSGYNLITESLINRTFSSWNQRDMVEGNEGDVETIRKIWPTLLGWGWRRGGECAKCKKHRKSLKEAETGSWLTTRKETETPVPQPRETELGQQPEWSWTPTDPQALQQGTKSHRHHECCFVRCLAGHPAEPCLDFWPTEL